MNTITEEEAYREFAIAVLTKAKKDWLKGKDNPAIRGELLNFFMTDTFDLFCYFVPINPDKFLAELKIKFRYLPEVILEKDNNELAR